MLLRELAEKFFMSVFNLEKQEVLSLQSVVKKILITPIPLLYINIIKEFEERSKDESRSRLGLNRSNIISSSTFYNTMFSVLDDILLVCICPGRSAIEDFLYITLGTLPVKSILFIGAYGAIKKEISPGDFVYAKRASLLDFLSADNIIKEKEFITSEFEEHQIKGFRPVSVCSVDSVFSGYYNAERIPEYCDVLDLETYYFYKLMYKLKQQLTIDTTFISLGLVTDHVKTLKLFDSDTNTMYKLRYRSVELAKYIMNLISVT